jgi:hypothetical protein
MIAIPLSSNLKSHMKKNLLLLISTLFYFSVSAQGPEVTSWIINTNGGTGYNNIPSNVQQVRYGTSNVYVTCTSIPSYGIGPWSGNPNIPSNQNLVFKITRTPAQNTGTLTNTPLGHIGVWSNGVTIFNPLDAMSYNNQNVWHQNAYFWESSGFDNCLGHPNQQGEYHHHVNPTCLYDDNDSTNHSPIIGYAFDGFPIYGAYGYDNPSTPGATRRMVSSYHLRTMSVRDTLPNGNPASSAGPSIGGMYPLGAYIEDYEYIASSGDLDAHNGRFCVTPDYPGGIYAYFVTIDYNQEPEYPYVLGTTYYGIVQSGNTGPGSGHNTPSETVTIYDPTVGISDVENSDVTVYPNPLHDQLGIRIDGMGDVVNGVINDVTGKEIKRYDNLVSSSDNTFDISGMPAGIYFLRLDDENGVRVLKLIKN